MRAVYLWQRLNYRSRWNCVGIAHCMSDHGEQREGLVSDVRKDTGVSRDFEVCSTIEDDTGVLPEPRKDKEMPRKYLEYKIFEEER